MNKVSFVCTTYRRYSCVQRLVWQYQSQTFNDKELIIFNTDEDNPYSLGFVDESIKIINNGVDYVGSLPYTNRGDILRDAVTHSDGDYFMLADDDDIYLPWHIQQAVDGIKENGKDAWKPEMSMYANKRKVRLMDSYMEASVIVKMSRIKEIGFRSDKAGCEGLSWYFKLRSEGNLDESNKNFIPSYCFNWSDPREIGGHKQSSSIDRKDNFELHKENCKDICKAPLMPLIDEDNIKRIYDKYYRCIMNNLGVLNMKYYDKYMRSFVEGDLVNK